MRIPKGADIQLKTENDALELHITAAITTKAQANDLISCIRQVSGALESERRSRRKPKIAEAA
ncbi:hypothetical protein ACVMGC_003703 [Bradyrhizobium barranii subsp. barranii]